LQGLAHTYGGNTFVAWGAAFTGKIPQVKAEVDAALKAATRSMVASSPPTEGPLRDIVKWGENLTGPTGWGLGAVRGITAARAAINSGLGGIGPMAGAGGRPAFAGGGAMAGGGRGGTQVIQLV